LMETDLAYCNNIYKLVKNWNLNTPLDNGGFSLICLGPVWRQCYCTMELSALLSHWLMQFMWKKHMRTCCKKYIWTMVEYCADQNVTAMLTGQQIG
jgi:hypothetical protein